MLLVLGTLLLHQPKLLEIRFLAELPHVGALHWEVHWRACCRSDPGLCGRKGAGMSDRRGRGHLTCPRFTARGGGGGGKGCVTDTGKAGACDRGGGGGDV